MPLIVPSITGRCAVIVWSRAAVPPGYDGADAERSRDHCVIYEMLGIARGQGLRRVRHRSTLQRIFVLVDCTASWDFEHIAGLLSELVTKLCAFKP